jgi:hypothetical protein
MARKKKVENAGTRTNAKRDRERQEEAMLQAMQMAIANMTGMTSPKYLDTRGGQLASDLGSITRGGVDVAQTPAGPDQLPPMRGAPYTSYNMNRNTEMPPIGVGPMGNMPFYYNENTLSFPPVYGMPRSRPGRTGPVVGEHFRFLPPTL